MAEETDVNHPCNTDDFDPGAPESFSSAHEMFRDMRAGCPVAHSNQWNGFWALFKYDDVVNVLKDYKTYITSVQNVVPKVAFTGRRPPLHLDPPEHTPYRRALTPFFSERKMLEIEPAVRRITVDLLQAYIDAGGGDICEDFAQKLPGHTFAEFFNLPADLAMAIKDVTKIYNKAVQEFDDQLVRETSLQLYDIARRIIRLRKDEPLKPEDDVTCSLLSARVDGIPLPEELVLGTIRQLIVVGMIAPSVFIGCMVIHLSEHPELQDQLRNNPDLIPAALEEYLRLFTPYRGFARTANRDVEIGGRVIRKNEPIALVYASANRDESVFPDPDTFILNRPNINRHIAFGLGPHQCAGMPLARLELRIVLEELLARTRGFTVQGEIRMTRWPEWGTLSVPVKVTPA